MQVLSNLGIKSQLVKSVGHSNLKYWNQQVFIKKH